MNVNDLLDDAARRAKNYLSGLVERRVGPLPEDVERLKAELGGSIPDEGLDPAEVLARLDKYGSPGTIASAGSRYFGFVTGGSLPAALAANWLAGAWDQIAAMSVSSPAGAAIEEIAQAWLLDVLDLPRDSAVGFVTGATVANFACLAAARHKILRDAGWDVEAQGLFSAPPITVVVGDEIHASMLKALTLVGFGRERVTRVPVDDQGRMRADSLPAMSGPTLVCMQAGNVNSGAFDPAEEICEIAHAAGAWVHVDAAFGLWVRAAPDRAYLGRGLEKADSWTLDAHKWLNVPYDSGFAICRDAGALRAAMAGVSAAYLMEGDGAREPYHYTPEMSRRARGVEIWAALLSLGRNGLADLVERTCRLATRFAESLEDAGYEILNDVVINQVVVAFGDAETTERVIEAVQAEGTMWAGRTEWQGRVAMRISVSSWATTDADVERSLGVLLGIARSFRG